MPPVSPHSPREPYTFLGCPLCPGKGPWRHAGTLVAHTTSTTHLRYQSQIDIAGPRHPLWQTWQDWRGTVRLDYHQQRIMGKETKGGQRLLAQYGARVQVLYGTQSAEMAPFIADERQLLDVDEFGGEHCPWPSEEPPEGPNLGHMSLDLDYEVSTDPMAEVLAISEESWNRYHSQSRKEQDEFDQCFWKVCQSDPIGQERGGRTEAPDSMFTESADLGLPSDQPLASPFDRPSSWFTPPPVQNIPIDHKPDNPWYPFESEIFARLFVFINCRTDPLSRRQNLRVWELLRRFSAVPVPSYNSVRAFDASIPTPRVYTLSTREEIPRRYTQVSITDQICMQLAIPGVSNQIQEFPISRYTTSNEISPWATSSLHEKLISPQPQLLQGRDSTTSCQASKPATSVDPPLTQIPSPIRAELWTGSKWLTTPSLQPPFTLLDNGTEAWVGMIIAFHTTEKNQHFGLLCGQSILEIDQASYQMIHYYPLKGVQGGVLFDNARLQVSTDRLQKIEISKVQHGYYGKLPSSTTVDCNSTNFVLKEVSTTSEMLVYIPVTGDSGEIQLVPPKEEDFWRVFRPHPVQQNRNRISSTLPVKVVNISI